MSAVFLQLLRTHGLPEPVLEHRFHPVRRWRWDYAWPAVRLAMEVQGGLFVQGRHSRGAALLGEHEKLNAAAALGWRVLFTTPRGLASMDTVRLIERALRAAA